jgi:transposase-like protein
MKYDKKIIKRICELIEKDSYTVVEICAAVGITPDTFYRWYHKKTEFSDAIKKARDVYDKYILSEAEKSLVKLIQGYTVKEEKTVRTDSGKKDEEGKPIVRVREHTVTDKHYQPNTAAVIFALVNRNPDVWKNRMSNEHTGKDGSDLFKGFNPETLSADERKLLLKIAEKTDIEP